MKPLLRTVILLTLIPMLIAITAFQAWRVHASIYGVILEGFNRTLIATGESVANRIDGDKHHHMQRLPPDAVRNEDGFTRYFDPKAPFFSDHREIFEQLRQSLGLTYLYTQVHLGEDQIYYVLDGSDTADWVPPGSGDVLPPESIDAIREVQTFGTPWVTDLLEWENWGLIKASYTPIRDRQGKVVAMVGADVDSSVVRTKTRRALFAVLLLGTLSIVVSVIVSVLISRTLTRPIDEIRDAALSLAAGNPPSTPLRAKIREVNQLATTLERLSIRLQEQQQEVTRYLQKLQTARKGGYPTLPPSKVSEQYVPKTGDDADSVAQRLFALQGIAPFDQLPATELMILAAACTLQRHAPGRILCPSGYVPEVLYLVVSGGVFDCEGLPQGSVVGAQSQLTGTPIDRTWMAGPAGCVTLSLPRGKFLTMTQNRPHLLPLLPTLEHSTIS